MARKAAIIGGGVIGALTLLSLVACQSNTRDYDAPPRTAEEKAMAVSCEAEGGQFARTGFIAAGFCKLPVYPAKDAGKACSDGSECEAGWCLASTSSCAPEVHVPYCEPVLKKGTKYDVLCAD